MNFDNATDTFPIDSKHSKINFDRFLSLLNTVIAIIALVVALRPSATEQEQLALQRTEVQILSEISRKTGVPYRALYDRVANDKRDRELRVDEFLALCKHLELDPIIFFPTDTERGDKWKR